MPRLLLLRHAKSDWNADYGHDQDRPLKERGRRAAALIGKVLAAAGEDPDRIVSSTANRARTTAELAVAAAQWTCPVELDERLYYASPGQMVTVADEHASGADRLLVVGHQPTLGNTASALIGGGSLAVKTATVAAIDFASWGSLQPGRGSLVYFFSPAFFRGLDVRSET